MSGSFNLRGVRRITAGIGLIGFPALLVVQGLVDSSDDAGFYAAALTHPNELLYSALLLLASAVMTVPAIGGILHQARDRGARLAEFGALFTLLGALGHTALAVMYLEMRSLAGGDAAEMVALETRFNSDPALGIVAMTLILSFGLGLTLLAWSAWRAGIVGWWAPALTTSVVLLHAVYPGEATAIVDAAAVCAIAVVFGWLGTKVLAMSDNEWNPTIPPKSASEKATSTSA